MKQAAKYVSLTCLPLAAVCLLPLQLKSVGFGLLLFGAFSLLFTEKLFRKHIILIYVSLGLLGTVEVNTDISLAHIATMGLVLATAIAFPYLVTRFVYKEPIITYPFHAQLWTRGHIGYLIVAIGLSYLILPLWMSTTREYQNWTIQADPYHLIVLFFGTNGLGIWDELFFIITVLALLRRHVSFVWANLIQAVLFTSFLYELGFRSWIVCIIFPFALLQGLVFRKTENLPYIIAIHLSIDFVLYLALIHAHHPDLLPLFVTYLR